MGIDPSTGREMFLKQNGEVSYTWDANDRVYCGVSEPKYRGNFSTMFRWRDLSLNLSFAYRLGGQLYNSTLASKVENADKRYNVDERVFTDRWQKPGDQVLFKAIDGDIYKEDTKESSRFVMDDNEFAFTTINLSYRMEASRYDWLKRVGISSATIGFYMEDICRFSTVKMERGIEYPFSRQASMSLSVTF